MNINDSIKSKLGVAGDKTLIEKSTSKSTQATKDKSAAVSQVSSGESVTLSPLSAQMKSIEAEATAGVFDADKVEAIKSAISSGQFKVDSEKVADGLIQTVKDLLTTKK
ncbi:MAG TPA: flagellar biosynthesis anti-sigma factor FlgM [Methylotenera sp.]|nr:flagellar biosynthesis anti-sigma factor FlgM [Methylotenera sp.]HPH04951.1 flagellar biosynthesis anti-sigma factor FlgM [Methylotenera sp.]HPN02209.1 flagellar biosynthesis anti-sigma factor FlgM [Methylotenera sp.]